MGISKTQLAGKVTTCACGCGASFNAFPVYRNKRDGGGLRYPEYKRGHHPHCRATQAGNKPAWNAGLTKTDHPSIKRMGFQSGHEPHNDWSDVNRLLREDIEIRSKWLAAKQGQEPWNRGKTKAEYRNGVKSGGAHGNWRGGHGGVRDTAEWQATRRYVYKRDNYTCQACGDHNYVGRGSRIQLEAHHIVAICEDPTLSLDPSNLILLCRNCHFKTHNFGGKAAKQKGK